MGSWVMLVCGVGAGSGRFHRSGGELRNRLLADFGGSRQFGLLPSGGIEAADQLCALSRLAAFGEVLDESDESDESDETRASYRDLVAEIRRVYLAATGAAVWLDHRDDIADPARMAGNLDPEQRERLRSAQRRVLHLRAMMLRAAHRYDTGRLES
ncbi:hypothetical protein [Nocardia sp. NPDC003963]